MIYLYIEIKDMVILNNYQNQDNRAKPLNNFYKSMANIWEDQGQVTPYSMVWCCPNVNLSVELVPAIIICEFYTDTI